MKGTLFLRITAPAVFAGILLPLAALSCAAAGEESPRRYISAAELYAQGRFAETAAMLGGEKRFPPALTLRAKAEYFSGDLEQAEKSCRQAIRRRPSASEAKLYLARILREKGDFAGAEKTAEELLADNPHDIRALRLAAELAGEGGKGDEAAALLDTAAELAAECAMVLLDRSRLRWIAGRGADALEDLARARAMLPPDTPLVRSVERLTSRIEEAAR
jgi:tetratricopeptide (TPR) repeat protein